MEPLLAIEKSCFLPFMKAKFKTKLLWISLFKWKINQFVPPPQCQLLWISLSILHQKNWTKFTKTNIVPSPNNTSLAVISTLLPYFDSSHNLGGGGRSFAPPPLHTPLSGGTGALFRKAPQFWNPPCCNPTYKMKKQTFRLIGNTPYHFENYFFFSFFCLACLAIIVLVGENSML